MWVVAQQGKEELDPLMQGIREMEDRMRMCFEEIRRKTRETAEQKACKGKRKRKWRKRKTKMLTT